MPLLGNAIRARPERRGLLCAARRLGPALLLGASVSGLSLAQAATPGGVEPGVIQREFQKPQPPKAGGPLVLRGPILPAAPSGAAETKLVLKGIKVEGATVFSQSQLQSYASALIGKEVAMSQVFGIAQAITGAYSDAGYPLSVAYLPAQEIKDGIVTIRVVEGFVSEVEVSGDAGNAADLLKSYGENLKAVRPLTNRALERYVLLANDIPGLAVRAVFDRASSGTGGVKLIFAVTRKNVEVAVGANNRGSRALGRDRGVVSFVENGNLTGRERIELDLVQAFQTRELSYVYGQGRFLVDSQGDTVGLTGTWSRSKPGTDPLESVHFKSDGWSAALDFSHPFVRSRALNIKLTGEFEFQNLNSDFGSTPNSRDRLRVLRSDLHTDFLDWIGGVTETDLWLSQGLDIFDATKESDPNKSRADGSAAFTSFLGTLDHVQPLTEGLDLSVSISGQIASRQLLASEECGYGGAIFGRAFDNYEISGENCANGAVELRYRLPVGGDVTLQPYGFYDAGLVQQKGALLPGEARRQTGQSIGVGVRSQIADHVRASLEFAQPLARQVAIEGNKDGRVFFSVMVTK